MSCFKERLEKIRARRSLASEVCGRDPDSVSLLAVSKFHPAEALLEAMECGITHFAENYVQEGMSKSARLPGATFALIGPLQRNKAKPALMYFRELLTVDRSELASRLVRLAGELGISREIWIQVDLWEEVSKIGGCRPSDVQSVLDALGGSAVLTLKGFMAIPPPGMTSAFGELARFRENWRQRLGTQIQLSMGMSDDLEEAIRAGSDQIRVGTALFGERYDQ
jgi:pyridoxal phosphate enzyme (YggS family)